MKEVTFQKALEIIESLPEEQREAFIEIVKRRLIEERRDRLFRSIEKAKEEFRQGDVKRGTADDLMCELSE